MKIGMEFFSGDLKKKQLSGRPYLQTQTGNAKRSMFVRQGILPGWIITNLTAGAEYLPIHQFGGIIRPKTKDYLTFKTSKGWVNTKKVKIPKRLKFFESFRSDALAIFHKHTLEAIRRSRALR